MTVQELAATAGSWTTTNAYRIPSRSRPGLRYLVTANSCSCKSFVAGGFVSCIHVEAVRLIEGVVEPPCQDLVLERLPNGELAWLRPEAGQ